MKRAMSYLLVLTLLMVPMTAFAEEGVPQTEAGQEQAAEPARPALTAAQQQELAQIYQALYANKELLIKKYHEFGVITQEQANLWTTRLRERHAQIEKHGFLPPMKRNCDKNNDNNHDDDKHDDDKYDRKSGKKSERKGKH